MNTRSTRRDGGGREVDGVGDERKDPLVRPSIKIFKRYKADHSEDEEDDIKEKDTPDKEGGGLRDATKSQRGLDNVDGGQTPSDSTRRVYGSKSSKPTSVNKSKREEEYNTDQDHSGSESDDEEEYIEEKKERMVSKTYASSSKAVEKTRFSRTEEYRLTEEPRNSRAYTKSKFIDDHNQERGDPARLPTPRARKVISHQQNETSKSYAAYGEREGSGLRDQGRKAFDKEQLLNSNKSKAFSDDEDEQPKPQPAEGNCTLWILFLALIALAVVASLVVWRLNLQMSTMKKAEEKLKVMNTFQDGFRKLPIVFSAQSPHLWQRSQRILELQLANGNQNKEPAIILLTAAQDGEQMLLCIGNLLAKTYASALNSSYTVLSGLDMTSENSEGVKLDIDQMLSGAFQADSKVAVLHRVELLPPGSLIILYKYCDHENAAYKNIALVLTVLLKKPTLEADIKLPELEEAVYDFFKETFINRAKSRTSHDQMDGDKLGGVWSRISHVVLPVFPGDHNVKECGDFKATP